MELKTKTKTKRTYETAHSRDTDCDDEVPERLLTGTGQFGQGVMGSLKYAKPASDISTPDSGRMSTIGSGMFLFLFGGDGAYRG